MAISKHQRFPCARRVIQQHVLMVYSFIYLFIYFICYEWPWYYIKTFTLMKYCLLGAVLTPLLGFIEELKFKEKKDFQKNLWSSLLLKTFFLLPDCLPKRTKRHFWPSKFWNLDPPRGSCLWHSLLPLPTFVFKLSTPKLIENPAQWREAMWAIVFLEPTCFQSLYIKSTMLSLVKVVNPVLVWLCTWVWF